MFRILFFLIWPFLRLYMPKSTRVRVIIQKDDSYLFVKNKLRLTDQWHFPGGGVKKGETILQAVLREIAEELSIDLVDMQLLDDGNVHRVKQSGLLYKLVFVSARIDADAKIQPNHEIAAYEWKTFSSEDKAFCSEVRTGLGLL